MSGISERLGEQKDQALNEQQIDEWIDQLESIKHELEEPELDNLSKVNEKKQLKKRIERLQKHLENADVMEEQHIETIQKLKRQIKEFGNETYLLRRAKINSEMVTRHLEEEEKKLKEQIAELEKKNKSLQKKLRQEKSKSTGDSTATTGDSTATTWDSTPKDMILSENDLTNIIRKRKEEREEAQKRLEGNIKRQKKEKEKLEKRIAKLQQESRDRFKLEEERRIAEENKRFKNTHRDQEHTFENITGKPDYLERIKEIELSINSQSVEDNYRSLADEIGGLDELDEFSKWSERQVGERVEVKLADESKHRSGEITRVNLNGTFNIKFDNGELANVESHRVRSVVVD